MIVAGQVHGGLAQGIGQAVLEGCVYDKETGQLLTGSYNDYAMPRADDFPEFKLSTNTTLCTHNPLGVKGCGEAGAIGAPAAIANAIVDALTPLGRRAMSRCRRRRTVCGRHRSSSTRAPGGGRVENERDALGERPDVRIRIQPRDEPRRRREPARQRRGGKARRRRHDAASDPEAASREAHVS